MGKFIRILLIVFFLLLLGLEIAVYVVYTKNQATKPFPLLSGQQPTPTPSIQPSLSLSLAPTTVTITPNQPISITVVMEQTKPGNAHPTLAQLEIAYDPAAISQIVVTPGPYFSSPTILLNTLDATTGRLSYAISGTTNERANSIATLTITPNPFFHETETSLSFLPKTMLKGTTGNNLLMATYGTKLYFASGSATIF